MNEEDKLTLLKEILLTDDREFSAKIQARLGTLESLMNNREQLSAKVNPIIAQELENYTKSIPDTLGSTITETLKKEIKNSRDEVVDALYPILGKMIKKYISQEMKVLAEKINNQLNWKKRVRNVFGTKNGTSNVVIVPTKIEQVLLIDKASGLLTAHYSNTKSIDEEMISGMLTAIKAFVEDAYLKKEQNLELIEYEFFKIHIQSFVKHYVAIVLSGDYNIPVKNTLQNIIFNFYQDFTDFKVKTNKKEKDLNHRLGSYFANVSF